MEPMTMALVASTAMSAMGAIQQGNAQSASYDAQARANEYNAQVQRQNATVARNNAQMASEQANAREEAQRRHFGALQGQAIAGVAQSGTGFDGSNTDLLAQNAVANELDALTIRYEGQNQSAAFMNQASNLESQAALDVYSAGVNRMNSSSARQAGYLNAGANLLSGASKYAYFKSTSKLPTGIPTD